MAIYEFECVLDGFFDRNFDMGTAPSSIACPTCGDEAMRKFRPTPVVLKGPGFYSTDSRK